MTDAVKMAIEALRPFAEIVEDVKESASGLQNDRDDFFLTQIGGYKVADLFTDDFARAAEALAALEQAGEPVDVALLDRAELAWQRFFYPAADCFTGPIGDKLPAVDLEVADCLRLVLAAVGRLVVTPEADVPAPLTTLQRLGKEFDGEGEKFEGQTLQDALKPDQNGFSDAECIALSLGEYARDRKREGLPLTARVNNKAAWLIRSMAAALSTPTPAQVEPLSVDDAWQDLVEKDDRTSPDEYPDMALITYEELADYMQAAQSRGQAVKTDWVDCPICDGTDMRREVDSEGYALIFCVNHSCPSNDASASRGQAFDGEGEGFAIGDPVEKFTGEAIWHGVIVASYLTSKGKRRYVVEVDPQGFQMIAVPSQLRAASQSADRYAMHPDAAASQKGDE